MVDVGKLWRDLILDIPDVGRCPRWPHLEPKPSSLPIWIWRRYGLLLVS